MVELLPSSNIGLRERALESAGDGDRADHVEAAAPGLVGEADDDCAAGDVGALRLLCRASGRYTAAR